MIVDTHQHFWDPQKLHYPWMNRVPKILLRSFVPDDLKPELVKPKVDRTIVVQAVSSMDEAPWLLQLADKTPFIAGVVTWANLEDPNVGAVVDGLKKHPKFVGVRHQVEEEQDKEWLLRPAVLRGLRELAKRDVPYELLIKPYHLHLVKKVADACPGLCLSIDHGAKPNIKEKKFDEWAPKMAEVARIPGILCKISGLNTEADHQNWKPADIKPYIEHLVKCFGYDRLMFGSDWPVCLLAGTYQAWWETVDAVIKAGGEKNWKKVFGENACSYYKIKA